MMQASGKDEFVFHFTLSLTVLQTATIFCPFLDRAVSYASNRDQKCNRYSPLLMETPEPLSESDTPNAPVR
jgi:hypothetical protein